MKRIIILLAIIVIALSYGISGAAIYTFCITNAGVPQAGLSPTWASLNNVADSYPVSQPSISNVANGGCYKYTHTAVANQVGFINAGGLLAVADQYVQVYMTPDDQRIQDLDAAVSSRAAASTALSTETWTALRASMLNAPISNCSTLTTADILGNLSAGVFNNLLTVTTSAPVEVVRGDATPLTLTLGSAWPLTGKKVYLTAKATKTAATAVIDREATVTDEDGGIATITLTTSETATVGSYYAEVEVRDTDGTNPRTARQFTLKIIQDIRQ